MEPGGDIRRKNTILALIICALGLILLVQWIYNLFHRIPFPYPIEYIEDAIFLQAMRIADGLPVYSDPSHGYSALIYTPGYLYILAGLFKLLGPSIIIGRVVNLICVIVIGVLLWKLSSRRLPFPLSLVPMCAWVSLPYAYFAGYQDLGRVDPLMTLMVIVGLFLCDSDKPGRWRLIAGILMLTLACFVKQPAMAYLYFAYIWIFIRHRTAGVLAIVVSFITLVGLYSIGNAYTAGWFGFYTFELPMTHDYNWAVLDELFFGGRVHATVVRGILPFAAVTVIYIIFRLFTLRRERMSIFEATLPGAIIATVGPFLKEGGFHQDLIPLHTHLCFILPFALSLKLGKMELAPSRKHVGNHVLVSVLLFLIMLHCVFAIGPWDDYRPRQDNLRLGNEYVERVSEYDGEVLMPSMTYYGWLAGKDQEYLGVSLVDLERLMIKPYPLMDDITSGRYEVILLPLNFNAEGYWGGSLEEAGYTGPTWLMDLKSRDFELCPTMELPSMKVYIREE